MPAGGKLTIETAGADLDEAFCRTHIHCNSGPHVLLTVSDNGTGIDPADLPHVFEPFFTTKAVDKGTGLGLATVYGIVKQNGGYVSVYSEPGRGTTFRIYIPRDLTAGDADRTAVRDSSAESLTASPMETVLLVEDDEMVRNIARAMLGKARLHGGGGPDAHGGPGVPPECGPTPDTPPDRCGHAGDERH